MKKINIIQLTCLLLVGTLLTSCYQDPKHPGRTFMPDMQYSQAYETNAQAAVVDKRDSMATLQPVANTIAYGSFTNAEATEESQMAYRYKEYFAYEDDTAAAVIALQNPFDANDAAVKKEGKILYQRFCMVCHGPKGEGEGPIVLNGGYPVGVPVYADRIADKTGGQVFHTITYGLNMMGSHASQLSPDERWKVVLYVQSLAKVGPYAEGGATETEAAEGEEVLEADAEEALNDSIQ